jgi:transcriptional regulator with XRE-family HTH domain
MTTETNVFGNWLRKKLDEKRMTGGEFAQRARLSRPAVYFYLDGKRVPDEAALARIVASLGVELESLPAFERKANGRPRKKADL